MYENEGMSKDTLTEYQAGRLQTLVQEMVKCCEDRRIYENKSLGLPYAEIRCLLLFDGEQYLTVNEIARRMDVAKSRATKLVRGLLDKGYLERTEDPRDTRVKLINTTDAGKKKIKEVEDFHLQIHKELINLISPEDRSRMLGYLEMLRNSMEEIKQKLL